MWKRLTHSNIVPLLGVTITPFQLISDWMSGGDLPEYLKKHSDVNRLDLVGGPLLCLSRAQSRSQLSDVAQGLCYLHSCNVIHGDLKGVCSRSISRLTATLTPGQPNILVDDSGNARIVDFGLTTVTQNLDSQQSTSCHQGHTPRWTAPEVLSGGVHTKEADTFAFAMVMTEVRCKRGNARKAVVHLRFASVQVFTGMVPFSELSSPMAMYAIMQGERPPRPTHPTFTENLWVLMQRCWGRDPHLRPEVSEVLQVLLTPLVSHSLRQSHFLTCLCSKHPAWKQLISHTLATDERISLITTIFLDENQVKMVERLSGDDAQTFIDKIDEVGLRTNSHSNAKLIKFDANLHTDLLGVG